MTRSYAESAAARRARWSDDTRAFADQAAAVFSAEVAAHRALGEALVAARENAHLTQNELEAISSVQQPVISRIERGLGNPTVDTLFKLTSALNVDITFVPTKITKTRNAPTKTPQHS